jgi:hypothetical protein
MLKKYKTSGTSLSEKQMKEIKGGTGQSDFSEKKVQCRTTADCGSVTCDSPSFPDRAWYCNTSHVCILTYCP